MKRQKSRLLPRGGPQCRGDSAPAKSGANNTSSGAHKLSQRAELTFKQNRLQGRHGWLRLTPAYSVALVEQILDEFAPHAAIVFDPFSGSGTTALCAAYRGKTGIATDINPFLVWLANAKARSYHGASIESFKHAAQIAVQSAADPCAALAECPPLRNIERWWGPAALIFLLRLKAAIDVHEPADATLLQVAFCRTLMKLSNAAFNHQSMSFKPVDCVAAAQGASATDSFGAQFLIDVDHVAVAAANNPSGSAQYIQANARAAPLAQWRDRVDLLITSPPYPNRMSYIRELRPYMYWMRFLATGRQAGELDWEAIGGTWGVATSRLTDWAPADAYQPPGLAGILKKIRAAHADNGRLLANYVHKYFEDMFEHLGAMLPLLRRGATVHYIVGNSIFYGHMVCAEQFLARQMAAVGLCDVRIIPIRKRNSKQGLLEFHVTAARQA
ncbi:MAG: DNA methyltransferase [Steroidobacteraceae bacterium]